MISSPAGKTVIPRRAVKAAGRDGRLRLLRTLVTALLAVLLLYQAVQLARILLAPTAGTPADSPPAAAPAPAAGPVDLAALQDLNLFGAGAALPGPEFAAAESRLDLRLEGVVLAQPESAGFALIAAGGRPAAYRVGDALPGGRVRLSRLFADHVLVDNDGALEALRLYELPAAGTGAGGNDAETAPASGMEALIERYRRELGDAAPPLSQLVQVSPVREGGLLVGYRLSPGPDAALFGRLGLEAGDILTRVNGVDLDRPDSLARLYAEMSSAREFSFSLLRRGSAVQLQASLDSLAP